MYQEQALIADVLGPQETAALEFENRQLRLHLMRPRDALAYGGVCSKCLATRHAYLYEWRNLIYANRYVGLTGIKIWDGYDGRSAVPMPKLPDAARTLLAKARGEAS